ncbi:hypothetical protein ERO13_D10G190000v2 [Gossypium hirsutum]|uniref:Uncharacterized protein isoform X1 n=2 Tax=Gossypium TaxID=3633 RepID=A0A1U8KB68_GOSHI|nr:uncharacterized protein LOC107915124 isoform X1 [Gossypium hirsutum]KAG4126981.1 hypothetical protein ERO13_D10G190000v2 [Gossypium hirsutum]TYH50800.1 hypothetical protein ES332_D10G230400v1 [Gossypium tomentosum]
MAASSPSASKSTSDATTTTTTTTAAATTPLPHPPPPFQRMDTLPKTQRGLTKPKCIQCGNVARSRCPYRSCKSCCSKAQNPCHIHVLKSNSAFPEKSPTSSTPSSDQKSTQASSQVTPLRVPSFKQLSNAFAQFDNLQVRSKKHLTRKDAIALNDWRFSKLKEFKDRNIGIENDAFDRYIQNISLLEEVFSIKSIDEGSEEDEGSKPSSTLKEDETSVMISGLKLTLKSDPVRTDNARKRIKQIVDQGIEKLHKAEANDDANDPDDQNKLDSRLNKVKSSRIERALVLCDIVDKLSKARNEEDLKSCLELKAQLYNQSIMSTDTAEIEDPGALNKESTGTTVISRQVAYHPSPKMLTQIEIDQETLNKIEAHFTSQEQIEDL